MDRSNRMRIENIIKIINALQQEIARLAKESLLKYPFQQSNNPIETEIIELEKKQENVIKKMHMSQIFEVLAMKSSRQTMAIHNAILYVFSDTDNKELQEKINNHDYN